jgi:hypothetical protein
MTLVKIAASTIVSAKEDSVCRRPLRVVRAAAFGDGPADAYIVQLLMKWIAGVVYRRVGIGRACSGSYSHSSSGTGYGSGSDSDGRASQPLPSTGEIA